MPSCLQQGFREFRRRASSWRAAPRVEPDRPRLDRIDPENPLQGSRASVARMAFSDSASTTCTTRCSSARGPPRTMNPASTSTSMTAACASQSRPLRQRREGPSACRWAAHVARSAEWTRVGLQPFRSSPIFPVPRLDELAAATHEVEIEAGAAVVTLDDYGTAIYFIEQGEVEVRTGRWRPTDSRPGRHVRRDRALARRDTGRRQSSRAHRCGSSRSPVTTSSASGRSCDPSSNA